MPTKRRVTMRDVADECGLALSTVSNALAGKRHVSAETRRLVKEASAKLGFRVSGVARALRMHRSFAIGVLMADVSDPSFAEFVRGIEDVTFREGYSLLLCDTDDQEEMQVRHMQTLLDRQVDGIVLISQHTRSDRVRDLLRQGPPFVLIQRRSKPYKDSCFVGSDTAGGVAMLAAYLHKLGHRRIGFVHGPAESSVAQAKYEAFRAACDRHGFVRSEDLVLRGDYSEECGRRALREFASRAKPVTAIMASNDVNALGVLDAAAAMGLDVPGDISVTGFDDIAVAGHARINLTTVRQPKREMGAAAADLLIRRIKAKRAPRTGKQLIFPTTLVVRGSTGPARRV